MSEEQEFIQELRSDYEKAGWTAGNPENSRKELGFRPDLVLHRGDKHLVVDVRKEGFSSTRAASILRKLVESKPGWKFELKFIPSTRRRTDTPAGAARLRNRIDLAQSLRSQGQYSEAFILAWTAVEATFRVLFQTKSDIDTLPPSALFKKGYEDGIISDNDFRQLTRSIQARNRVVHGLSVDHMDGESAELLHIADRLVDQAEPL